MKQETTLSGMLQGYYTQIRPQPHQTIRPAEPDVSSRAGYAHRATDADEPRVQVQVEVPSTASVPQTT